MEANGGTAQAAGGPGGPEIAVQARRTTWLRQGLIHIPKENGSITWKLPRNFVASSTSEAAKDWCVRAVARQLAKEDVVRVILKVWSSNPNYRSASDYAVVEMSEEFA